MQNLAQIRSETAEIWPQKIWSQSGQKQESYEPEMLFWNLKISSELYFKLKIATVQSLAEIGSETAKLDRG